MRFRSLLLPLILALFANASAADSASDVVVKDGDVEITRAEFEAALELTPDKLQRLAAMDVGDRLELINSMVQVRKMAAAADELTSETPGYWELQFQLLAAKKKFIFDREVGKYSVPNAYDLAKEYYRTQKDKYATRPELRKASHILLASPPGQPREEVRERAQQLLDELRAGADFEAYVEEYSEDPRAKSRGGKIEAWMRFGDPSFTPPFTEALFEIEEIGEYSEITDSPFGIHIIRLDDVEPGGYYSFEEVRDKIFNDIIAEYRSLAIKEVNTRYNISDDAKIDGPAMEELFAPYKPR